MRLILAVAGLVLAVLVGLWVYGVTLKPKTQHIQQEAVHASAPQP